MHEAKSASSIGVSPVRRDLTVAKFLEVWLRDAMDVVAVSGRTVLAACAEGDTLRTQMAALRRFTKYEPVDRIGLQRKVAARMLAAERFTIA